MVIQHHKKMVDMWVRRYREIKKSQGVLAATVWSKKMFSPEDIREINNYIKGSKEHGRVQ